MSANEEGADLMSQETILVVDDDKEIVGAIAAALEKEGWRVLRAYDGMERWTGRSIPTCGWSSWM